MRRSEIAHWSHKSKKNCDSWHEAETDWHRMWKNYFPENWQEIIKYDQDTGEKHIVDVCTENGMYIRISALTNQARRKAVSRTIL